MCALGLSVRPWRRVGALMHALITRLLHALSAAALCVDEQKTNRAGVMAVRSAQAKAHPSHTQIKMHEKEEERASERQAAENISSRQTESLRGRCAVAAALYKQA